MNYLGMILEAVDFSVDEGALSVALSEDSATFPEIVAPSEAAAKEALERWNSIAKPLGGLGVLEDVLIKIAALMGKADVSIDKRAVVVMCADNGVVAQGVSQSDQSVTRIMAQALVDGAASVNRMAQVMDVDVIPVDMGIATPVEGLRPCAVARGTSDFSKGPAMNRDQAIRALAVGVEIVRDLKEKGYELLAAGELGVGNTTSSAALASVLLEKPPAQVTGRGSGFTSAGLARKIEVIEQSIALNDPDPFDPLDLLAKLGGFDIAGMAGLYIGGALFRVPVLVDGLVSSVAALIAKRLVPGSEAAMIASHVSSEPAARFVLEELGLAPLITAGMHLGEGSGAVAAIPLLDMACAVYGKASLFDEVEIPAYELYEDSEAIHETREFDEVDRR